MSETRAHRLRHEAEALGARLPPLLVYADRVAATVAQGVHGRRRVGLGESFWQFRQFQNGDPIGAIDWRQSAKGDKLLLREHEWEAAQTVWFWVDPSASMRFASKGETAKYDRALVLALAIASLLLRGGECIACMSPGMRPMRGHAALTRFGEQLLRMPEHDGTPDMPLPRNARAVLIADWLAPVEETQAWLRRIHEMGVRAYLIVTLDPAECDLPYRGRVRFQGLENDGIALIGDVQKVRADYLSLMDQHRAALADVARYFGWRLGTHRTDLPAEQAVLAAFTALAGEAPR